MISAIRMNSRQSATEPVSHASPGSLSASLARHFFLFSLILLCSPACTAIDTQVQEKVALSEKTLRIAVLPFHVKGADWGDELADVIGHELTKQAKFEQVERTVLNKILTEQGFSQTGLIDDQTRLKIGKLTSANLIITGQGTALKYMDKKGKTWTNLIDTLSVKAIDVETGKHVISLRKRPGRSWTTKYRLMWGLTLGMVWDLEDILIATQEYDEIAMQIADKIQAQIIAQQDDKLREKSLQERDYHIPIPGSD
ncbi:MAG: hypothetical protein KDK39_05665 [Leptospiraceae bacterium]|nr:hypothetical protein [Leptospiraceae bacterium]